jgi:hypothetical protein
LPEVGIFPATGRAKAYVGTAAPGCPVERSSTLPQSLYNLALRGSAMPQEILSVAIWEPLPGMESASLATVRELTSIVAAKNYGRDLLYRDRESHYILLRYWKSEQSRNSAQEDPDMLRCWARLGNEINIIKVYETLTEASM